MRILFFTLLASLLFNSATFAHEGHMHDNMDDSNIQNYAEGLKDAHHTVTIQINGLVCDFCARALEKVFGKRNEVTGIDVNLDTKIVTIGLKEGTDINDTTITKLITDAGYNVVQIRR